MQRAAGELYQVPPWLFEERRDRLAERLRLAHCRELADAIARLPVPSVEAWAINRVARGRHAELELLCTLAHERRARDRHPTASAVRPLRPGLEHVAARVVERVRALTELHQVAVDLEAVRATLLRAGEPEVAAALRSGTLVRVDAFSPQTDVAAASA
jgi:hypothetical protein